MNFKELIFIGCFLIGASSFAETPSKGFESFKRNVYPILQNQCVKCHSDSGPGPNHSSQDPWTSYRMISRYTNFMDLKSSKLVVKGSNGHGNGYGGNVQTTEAELIGVLKKWWDEGENTTFLDGKKVLSAQKIKDLNPDGSFKTLTWDLGETDTELKGVKFQVDIQRFITKSEKTSGAYRLKNPRLNTNNTIVAIRGLHVIMNGIWNQAANNYSLVKEILASRNSEEIVLSPYAQILVEMMGEGQDQITFAFSDLKRGEKAEVSPPSAQTQVTAKMPQANNSKISVFDESTVGQAAIFAQIKTPATFEMGSPENQEGRFSEEKLHSVKLKNPFEIQSTAVTQLQWYLVMKDTDMATPSYFKSQSSCDTGNFMTVKLRDGTDGSICKNHPVERVSWNDAQTFLTKLNQMQNSHKYRLPTEAEWEYVAKSGLPAEYAYGWGGTFDSQYAWFTGNSMNRTHEVATRIGIPSPSSANDLIYDMSGNVWQWVNDWYGDSYGLSQAQLKAVTEDPKGPASGSYRVMRGGGWSYSARYLRSAVRNNGGPGDRYNYDVGFRLVRTANK